MRVYRTLLSACRVCEGKQPLSEMPDLAASSEILRHDRRRFA